MKLCGSAIHISILNKKFISTLCVGANVLCKVVNGDGYRKAWYTDESMNESKTTTVSFFH